MSSWGLSASWDHECVPKGFLSLSVFSMKRLLRAVAEGILGCPGSPLGVLQRQFLPCSVTVFSSCKVEGRYPPRLSQEDRNIETTLCKGICPRRMEGTILLQTEISRQDPACLCYSQRVLATFF